MALPISALFAHLRPVMDRHMEEVEKEIASGKTFEPVDRRWKPAAAENKRYRLRQYMPAYFDPFGYERITVEFDSLDEMLAVEFIARWNDDKIVRFSVSPSDRYGSTPLLMAEMKDRTFWVLGCWITAYEGLGLPEWHHPKSIGR